MHHQSEEQGLKVAKQNEHVPEVNQLACLSLHFHPVSVSEVVTRSSILFGLKCFIQGRKHGALKSPQPPHHVHGNRKAPPRTWGHRQTERLKLV